MRIEEPRGEEFIVFLIENNRQITGLSGFVLLRNAILEHPGMPLANLALGGGLHLDGDALRRFGNIVE